jgi:glutamyl-tRNA reductase
MAMDSNSAEKIALFQQIFGIDEEVEKEKEELARLAQERLATRSKTNLSSEPDLSF